MGQRIADGLRQRPRADRRAARRVHAEIAQRGGLTDRLADEIICCAQKRGDRGILRRSIVAQAVVPVPVQAAKGQRGDDPVRQRELDGQLLLSLRIGKAAVGAVGIRAVERRGSLKSREHGQLLSRAQKAVPDGVHQLAALDRRPGHGVHRLRQRLGPVKRFDALLPAAGQAACQLLKLRGNRALGLRRRRAQVVPVAVGQRFIRGGGKPSVFHGEVKLDLDATAVGIVAVEMPVRQGIRPRGGQHQQQEQKRQQAAQRNPPSH